MQDLSFSENVRRVGRLVLAAVIGVVAGCASKDDGRTTTTVENAAAELPQFAPPPMKQADGPDAAPAQAAPSATTPAPKRGLVGLLTSSSSASPASSSPASSSAEKSQPAGPSLDERLLFFPVKYPDGDYAPSGLRVDDAWFQSADGTKLHGWYCPVERPTAVLLYCHGNGGNLTYDAPLLRFFQLYLKATVLEFDYRGYGRSEGRPTAEGVVADARAARAYLARKAGVSESQIVLMGRSLGGAVAVQLTTDVRPRGLVLESTFSSLKEMAKHHYPLLSGVVPADKLDSAAALARYDGPLLQSHGDADRVIPFASGEALFLTAKGKKEFFRIPKGDHNDQNPPEYYSKLISFVAELP